ncbi:ABC transporter permease [Cupriavidus oxalaticus]|uniref:ABC transporter permease n=1 Tax=Cupriavidus oxalaticus TaxID=96344 RepID=A0A5P3VD48_9BURK|nr:ABC transporter permease [Cupriavidus oxalaticus]QEZ43755.1 ABC transporter permease [Cupriavidus oxalaticus]
MSAADLSLPAAAPRTAPLHNKTLNWRQATRWLLAWPVPLALLLAWYVASRHAWIPPQVLPAPDDVARTLAELWSSGELQANLAISALRVAGGFGVGLLGGLALGAAMGLSPTLRDYVYPTFKAFSQVPVLGWLPLLMLLVGIDEALKVILIAKAAFVPVALNTYKGIGSVPVRYLEVARVLQLTRWQALVRVVLPAAAAPVWNGARYGLTHAWLALVVVELLASSEGLGYMIVYGRQLFQLDMVLAAVVVVGVIGFALDKVLALAEGAVLRWRKPGF